MGGASTPEIPLLETANFTNVDITGTAVVPTGPLPNKPGYRLNDPENVQPVDGGWGVLEVVNNGNMNNVADAIRSIEDGGGNRLAYTLDGALNINDHGGNAANFGGDVGYGVKYADVDGDILGTYDDDGDPGTPEVPVTWVDHIATTVQSIADARAAAELNSVTADVLNHNDPTHGGPGSVGGDVPFPWNDPAPLNPESDENNVAVLVSGILVFPEAGRAQFGFRGDDGSQLTMLDPDDGGPLEAPVFTEIVASADFGKSAISGDGHAILFDGGTGNSLTIGELDVPAGGEYPFEMIYWEGSGGSYVELMMPKEGGGYELIAIGPGSSFIVPGAEPSLELTPEPATLALMGLGAAGALLARRRR